eukprot:CAMPEP_0184648108 /NCGR_PEP_ID=MMETSP0308-20130426/5186_1 /TAXON_ID=38269 /ORGANISM="Gloeochaete witrockiana, Strain SAG 46.84" /LENGTH=399 /DNA_ID=CAMNT_0027079689 /DNA_START=86 /DNA_END=1282 /DNA_ORIENTATION=+
MSTEFGNRIPWNALCICFLAAAAVFSLFFFRFDNSEDVITSPPPFEGSTTAGTIQPSTTVVNNDATFWPDWSFNDCKGGAKWCEDAKEALHALWLHQNPPDCSKAKFLMYPEPEGGSGIGSSLTLKAGMLTYAIAAGRVLVPARNQWPWGTCTHGGMDCLFMPLSWCTEETYQNDPFLEIGSVLDEMEKWRLVKAVHVANMPAKTHEVILKGMPPFADKHGLHFWRMVALRYLVRPNLSTKQVVSYVRSSLQLPRPIINIHVRHGDKGQEMELLPLSKYMAYAQQIANETGVHDVFLSTEDPTVIAEAQALQTNSNNTWRFFFQKDTCPQNLWQASLEERIKCIATMMGNLYIAGEDCDHFVGTLQSNWCEVIDALQRTNGRGGARYYDAHGKEDGYIW